MDLKLINRGSEAELLLIGRLDSYTTPEVEQVFAQLIERFNTISLDLARLEFVSSAGLRSLKQLHMAMRKKEGTLYVKNVTKDIMEVFEMTGLSGLLRFV